MVFCQCSARAGLASSVYTGDMPARSLDHVARLTRGGCCNYHEAMLNPALRSYLSPTLVGVCVETSLIWAVHQNLPPDESLGNRDYHARGMHSPFSQPVTFRPF